jgi:hypothetical protein
MAQWHYKRNYPLKPDKVTKGSCKKVWWKCPKGDDHEWEATPGHRTQGRGCPFCAGKRTALSNSSQKRFPKVALQWHPKKNGDLKPENVTYGSKKKVWWLFQINSKHEWEVKINTRTGKKSQDDEAHCPFCIGKQVSEDNNLAAVNPQLVKEWHPTKNNDLKPEDFTKFSNQKVWWKCPKGDDHEWLAVIKSRSRGSGGPFCEGQKPSAKNNFAVLFPEICKEWHPTKNGALKPEHLTYGSKKKCGGSVKVIATIIGNLR